MSSGWGWIEDIEEFLLSKKLFQVFSSEKSLRVEMTSDKTRFIVNNRLERMAFLEERQLNKIIECEAKYPKQHDTFLF